MDRERTHFRNEDPRFNRFNQLIDQNIEDPKYSIDDICTDLSVSRSQLFRLVKAHTGTSPSLYIRCRRLERARELLTKTDRRVVEITDMVGLDSPQTLTKYFTQEFGLSPTEYRKKQPDTPDAPTDKEEAPAVSRPASRTPKPRFGALYLGLAGMGLLILAVFLYFKLSQTTPAAKASDTFDNSIAVLPFRSGGKNNELLAEGLSGQVHASLASIENLKVISRTSTELLRESGKTIPQMAAELGVAYVLVGEVTGSAGKMRVSVELVEAAENRTVWAKNYEGGDGELVGFMNTMARQITGTLRQKLTSREYNKMNRVPTQNPEAYHEYLLGKQLLLSRQKEKLLAGVRRFDRAIALDSGFADAYAYKASAYFLLASSDFMNMQQGIRLSERNALAAIRLDGENGLAYASLANGYRQLNQWEQAVTTYQIALSHSPNDAQIIYWYSITLRALGRIDDAIRNSNRAVALDPLYPAIIAGHISNYSYAGRYADADRLFNEYALPLSNFYTYYFVKGYHYLNQGNYQDALSELMVSDSLAPAVPITEASVQYCRARLGQRKSAEAYLTSLPENPNTYHLLAIIYAGLEDKENCLKYLRLGAERGTSPFYLKVSPIFRFLHGDPRFDAVLNQLGLLDPRAI